MAKLKQRKSQHVLTLFHPADGSPIQITLNIILQAQADAGLKALVSIPEAPVAEAECPKNKFTYKFTTTNATVTLLKVASYVKENPGDSGEFTVCIEDASDKPKVHIIAMGNVDNVGGGATLMMTFRGKPMFKEDKAFTLVDNGVLMFNEVVELPR